ncbi:MAG: class I SAM-dependent methyltransferase family protein [Candidatus Bathyarchaeia archaeon]|jgi:tRNA (guanine37-N1)-methyltransferase
MKGYGIEVDNRNAQVIIRLLNKLHLLDDSREFIRRDSCLVIPVKRDLSRAELADISKSASEAKIIQATFAGSSRAPRDLRQAVAEALPSDVANQLPRSYDIVGDIGILELDDELQPFSKVIADGLMKLNPHLRMVVQKTERTSGQYRIRGTEVITGIGTTETVHVEFSSKFYLDVTSVYFNPRLAHERMRIASQVKEGEVVVDMFAGVGTYSILIAKKQLGARVFSIDLNPSAYKYLTKNVFENKVADRVTPYLGDAREFVSKSPGIADRVIMNLPADSQSFLGAASKLLKRNGGIVHFYCFASRGEELRYLSDTFRSGIESSGRRVVSLSFLRIIKEVGPNRVQVAIDARIV